MNKFWSSRCDGKLARKFLWELFLPWGWAWRKDTLPSNILILLHKDRMLKVATASTQPWRDIREQKLSYRGWQGQDRTVGTWCHYASDEIKPGTVLLPNLCEIIDSPVSKFLLLFNEMVHISSVQFSSVQSLTHVWLFATPWIAAHQASLSITNSWNSLRLMSMKSVMPSNHLILCHPLLLLLSVFPSIRVFSNESALCIRWPKYWSFSFNISPSNEHPGLISFRMDWLDLLAVQGTLENLLQHHSSKASIL